MKFQGKTLQNKLFKTHIVPVLAVALIQVSSTTSYAEIIHTYSAYTSIKDVDCATISSPDSGGLYHKRCASYAGYDIDVIGSDQRYGLEVKWGKAKVSHFPVMPFHVGKTVEWRYRIPVNDDRMKENTPPRFHALIYRLYIAQADVSDGSLTFLPREQDKQALIVVRLNKENSCIVGIIEQHSKMNDEARQRADDMTTPCIKINDE